MKPAVSVVVPCYNGSRDLAHTLDALISQSHRPAEIIVVDDGSTDHSADIAQAYGAPVKLIRQKNAGAAAARYTGIAAAKSELIVFNDSGDISLPDRIEHLLSALMSCPTCVAAFGATQAPQHKQGADLHSAPPLTNIIKTPFKVYLGQYWPLAPAMNLAARREVALQWGKVPPFYRAANDYALQIQLSRQGDFIEVPQALMLYEPTPGGLSAVHGLRKQRAYALIAADNALREHLGSQRDEELAQIFSKRVSNEWLELWLSLRLAKDDALARQVAYIGRHHGRVADMPSRLWWALDRAEEEGWLLAAPMLNATIQKIKHWKNR
jgi:glycosyltransferase involved in cell wall biosynthesis